MIRRGKIGRLPKAIREELNRRMQNGEAGRVSVEWLNSLPEVQTMLAADFGGEPISEHNLSDWRKGGLREWERHQEAWEWVREMGVQSDELETTTRGLELSEYLGAALAVEATKIVTELLADTGDDEKPNTEARWKRLRELLTTVNQLREEDRKLAWLKMEKKRRKLW